MYLYLFRVGGKMTNDSDRELEIKLEIKYWEIKKNKQKIQRV